MTEDELVGWHYQLDGHEFEQASLIVQLVKNLPAMQEIPVSGRSAGEGIGYPLQCSCLENPRDGGAWWAAIFGVTQSWT